MAHLVEQSANDPEFKGSNPAPDGTIEEKIKLLAALACAPLN